MASTAPKKRPPVRLLIAALLRLGWCVALRLTPLVFMTGIFPVHFLLVAKGEEKELLARFGQEYRDCRKRVPLLVPRFRRWNPGWV